MDIIDNLTNEQIGKNFNNQFDLVNYAIKLATNMIQTGREPRVKMSTENPALLILEEIAEGKDTFVEVTSREDRKVFKDVKAESAKQKSAEEVDEDEEDDDEDESDDTELLEEEEETQEVLSD